MDAQSTTALLALAFSLGVIHALDADHVMAVSNFIGKRSTLRRNLIFCSRWAIGHGTALFVIGFAVFIMGQTVPAGLSHIAEQAVGIVLILLGLWVLWDLRRKNAHIHFHQHHDLPKHAHWHRHDHLNNQPHAQDNHTHSHGAVMIGILHGTAGSAPLLALIPLTQIDSPFLGMLYLLIFAIGVLLSMLLFGGLFSSVMAWLNRFGSNVIRGFRLTVAMSTIVLGLSLLLRNS